MAAAWVSNWFGRCLCRKSATREATSVQTRSLLPSIWERSYNAAQQTSPKAATSKPLFPASPTEARPIYGEPFVMQTACKFWFLADSLPRFKHGTEAELRRTRFLRFDFQPPVKDVTLKARLACRNRRRVPVHGSGIAKPIDLDEIPIGGRESRAVHDRFRVSNDPVGAFVQYRCIWPARPANRKRTCAMPLPSFQSGTNGERFAGVVLSRAL